MNKSIRVSIVLGILGAILVVIVTGFKKESQSLASVTAETQEVMVKNSKTALIGTVKYISEPMFTSNDGSWYETANIYREIIINTEKKYYDELNLPSEVTVTVLGGEKVVPAEVAETKGFPLGTVMVTGEEVPFKVDERVLLFLDRQPIEFKDGPLNVITLRGGSQGKYRLEGNLVIHELSHKESTLQGLERLIANRGQ